MIRSRAEHASVGKRLDENAVAKIEEHILRCLGAAVIMQWNAIPTKLQRELFDTAGSLGNVRQTTELRGQIARFLHDHKDKETCADLSSGSSDRDPGNPCYRIKNATEKHERVASENTLALSTGVFV
jgi:hypothetical protein